MHNKIIYISRVTKRTYSNCVALCTYMKPLIYDHISKSAEMTGNRFSPTTVVILLLHLHLKCLISMSNIKAILIFGLLA